MKIVKTLHWLLDTFIIIFSLAYLAFLFMLSYISNKIFSFIKGGV